MKLFKQLTSTLLIALALFATVTPAAAAESSANAVININKADLGQLSLLPRVGPALAQRIVEHREANGDFKKAEDLMLVRGIGEKTFELMEPYVRVNGETTLRAKVKTPKEATPGTERQPKGQPAKDSGNTAGSEQI
jgi:comEA protein